MVNNLKRLSKSAALGLLATTIFSAHIAVPSAAFARAGAQDAAYDKGGAAVRDSWGKCVRTKWDGDKDPCAPAAPPPPAPVAQPAPPPPPPAPAPVKEEPKVELDQRTVYFAFDSAKLDKEADTKLDNLAKLINESKQIGDVSVVGYTDQLGTDSYNVALAKKRVAAVREYLDKRSRLDTKAADIRAVGKAPADKMCAAEKEEAKATKGKKGKKLSKKAAKAAKAKAAKMNKKGRAALIDCMKNERRVEIELKYVK